MGESQGFSYLSEVQGPVEFWGKNVWINKIGKL